MHDQCHIWAEKPDRQENHETLGAYESKESLRVREVERASFRQAYKIPQSSQQAKEWRRGITIENWELVRNAEQNIVVLIVELL